MAPPTASAPGTGLRSGRPARGSAARTGSSRWVVVVRPMAVSSIAISPSEPMPPRSRNSSWMRSAAAPGRPARRAVRVSSAPTTSARFRLINATRSPPVSSPDQVTGSTSSASPRDMATRRSGPRSSRGGGKWRWELEDPVAAHDDRPGRADLGHVQLAGPDHRAPRCSAARPWSALPALGRGTAAGWPGPGPAPVCPGARPTCRSSTRARWPRASRARRGSCRWSGSVSWASRYRLPLVRTGAPTVGSLTRTRSVASGARSAWGTRPYRAARRWLTVPPRAAPRRDGR